MIGELSMILASVFGSIAPSSPDSGTNASSYSSSDFGTVTYFQNLDKYSPNNIEGSCVYVALAIMLSYYDNFRNDNIISGTYERHDEFSDKESALLISPGVDKTPGIEYSKNFDALKMAIEETYPDDPETGKPDPNLYRADQQWQELNREQSNELWDYVHSLADTDFQMKLLSTRADLPGEADRDNFWTSGITNDYQMILDEIYGDEAIVFTRVEGDEANDIYGYDSLADLVKSKLNEGYIVNITIRNIKNNSRHAVVAYYHDDLGIHAHWGWNAAWNDVAIDTSKDEITSVGWLDFPGFPLEHSQNYVIDGIGYCGCGEHVIHSYSTFHGPGTYTIPVFGGGLIRPMSDLPTFGGPGGDGTYPPGTGGRPKAVVPADSHLAICACGYHEIQKHFTYEGNNSSDCSGCGITYSPLRVVPREINI